MFEEDYPDGNFPPAIGLSLFYEPRLFIFSLDMVSDLFVTKNKFMSKHPSSKMTFHPLFGEGSIFQESNQNWRDKRKALSQVFYKEKLLQMIEIVKEQC